MANPCRDPHRRCMPVHEWPNVDRHAWEQATASGDILDDAGKAAHWSLATRLKVNKSYGRWLTFLALNGQLDNAENPISRVSRERLRAYLQELNHTVAPVTVRGRILDLHEALRVMMPGADMSLVSDLYKRLGGAVPVRDKRRKVQHPARLYGLGIALMNRVISEAEGKATRQAVRYRDGLMIACLAARPLRRRTFIQLAIGMSLLRQSEGYLLCVRADETKTHQPYEAALPDDLTSHMDHYINSMRPVLLGDRRSDRLWITQMGTDMAADSFYLRLCKITERELGISLNPHIFRDSLATGLAIDDPDHVRSAAVLLGHRSLATTHKHYIQAKSLEASRNYQENLLQLRETLRPKPAKLRRKS